MSIVSDTLTLYLPAKRKTTPSGWTSFIAPCCTHNGETQDTKGRGGVIHEGEAVSYHCFNCGYKASWQPGRNLSYKFKKLLEWLDIVRCFQQLGFLSLDRAQKLILITTKISNQFG